MHVSIVMLISVLKQVSLLELLAADEAWVLQWCTALVEREAGAAVMLLSLLLAAVLVNGRNKLKVGTIPPPPSYCI